MNFVNPNRFTTRPEIEGTFGVVTSTHWIATAVGMGILERGGNAFDAACATAFTLQVVEPHLNGPGGDVPVILYDVRRGKPEVICGQGSVPAGATIAHYRDKLGLDLVPGTGLLAACIPGTFDTWMTLLRDYGTMRVTDVLSPAIGYARNGYPLVERICATIDTVKDLFRDHWPTSAALYLPGGKVPKPGSYFTNPTMADTYERILREAHQRRKSRGRDRARPRGVEQGLRRRGDRQVLPHAGGDGHLRPPPSRRAHRRRHGEVAGDRRGADLATTTAATRCSRPSTWTQGLVVLQQLALLKGFDLDGLDPAGPDFIHLQVECAKLAFADRDTFYGDPKFVDVPVEALLSDAYNDARRKLITKEASHEIRPGTIEGFGKTHGRAARRRGARRGRVERGGGADRRRHPVDARRGRSARRARRAGQEARAHGRDLGRHRALRHHRQGRQHGVVDAVRRLAAFLAGDPGARLPARHARADVLARGGPSGLARARQAPALDAHARRSRCATASRISPGARPAATSRTSGSRSSSCAMCMPA